MRAHDCPYRVVNSDHMQISLGAKIIFVLFMIVVLLKEVWRGQACP